MWEIAAASGLGTFAKGGRGGEGRRTGAVAPDIDDVANTGCSVLVQSLTKLFNHMVYLSRMTNSYDFVGFTLEVQHKRVDYIFVEKIKDFYNRQVKKKKKHKLA